MPQASNWIEVMWYGTPSSWATSGASGALAEPCAGQYGYFTISGGIDSRGNDIVKHVLDTSCGCDRPAAFLFVAQARGTGLAAAKRSSVCPFFP